MAGTRNRNFWLTSLSFEAFAHYLLMTLFIFAFALHCLTRPVFYAPFVSGIAALIVRLGSVVASRKLTDLASNTQPH
jgi:hypothetical protein